MFNAYVEELIGRHRLAGVLVDTNLLLLVVIGRFSRGRISTFKRTAVYSAADFDILNALLLRFARIVTTPNILTEVDNLVRQLPAQLHQDVARTIFRIASTLEETYQPSAMAMAREDHRKLGLSDTISLSLASGCLLLSDDMDLCGSAHKKGFGALNFNHIRPRMPPG